MALPNLWQTLHPGALTDAPQTKLGVWVAKALSCDHMELLFFLLLNPPGVILFRRGGTQIFAVLPRKFRDPASSQHHNAGGGGGGSPEKSQSIRSQLMALATHTPSLGHVGQGACV